MGSDFDYDGNKDMRITLEREIDEDLRLAVAITYTRNMAEATPDNLHERLVGSLDYLMNQLDDAIVIVILHVLEWLCNDD